MLNFLHALSSNAFLELHLLQVACDGGGGALGHPKVYINLDDGQPKGCIYCGLRFQLDPKAAAAAH